MPGLRSVPLDLKRQRTDVVLTARQFAKGLRNETWCHGAAIPHRNNLYTLEIKPAF